MGERSLLIDTDIFVLLAGAGMLDRVIDLFGFTKPNVYRLDAVTYQIQRSASFKKYPAVVRSRALAACGEVVPLAMRDPSTRTLARLSEIYDLDDGEVQLIAAMMEQDTYFLATGDKRAIRAAARDQWVRPQVQGRIICLETALIELVCNDGIEIVASAFSVLRDVNTTLRVVFSRGDDTSHENCIAGLDSYLNELIADVGSDFLYSPSG